MYANTASYYDRLYAFKDYADEATKVADIVAASCRSGGKRLLDVACGTGMHVEYLAKTFDAEGLDISPELLAFARERNPGTPFHIGDMRTFDLGTTFDVVTCLFSSIGYMTSPEDLHQAIARMAAHLQPGGLLIVEPWLTPDVWKPHTVHGMFIDEPEIKIARINTSQIVDGLSVFDLHHLIGTPEGVEHIVEHHEMGLWTVAEMTAAFEAAGLDVEYDPEGITGRGLYIGQRG
ncbi:class I SAM-dependent methyltransferase [Candidatus Bipolaricaulota bacterium]|nr:class I SAM-dependent methyltransferase [Candidatus Bipolaricaulota bacterium]